MSSFLKFTELQNTRAPWRSERRLLQPVERDGESFHTQLARRQRRVMDAVRSVVEPFEPRRTP